MTQPLGIEDQVRLLADLYSKRAEAYDRLWSPVIAPIGKRLLRRLPLGEARKVLDVGTGAGALLPGIRRSAPTATVLGIDRSEGMLALARQKHRGPLALMEAERLGFGADEFDVAVVAFVLFHLPDPQQCLNEVARVLRTGGAVGMATWAREEPSAASLIWDEELAAAGAQAVELPATNNRSSSDSVEKVAALLERTGFDTSEVWTESLEHLWPARDHLAWHLAGISGVRLQSMAPADRDLCISRIRARLAAIDDSGYTFHGEVVLATAVKAWCSYGDHG